MASELNLGRVKGTDGAPGAPGAPGTPGKDGKSAYQAAVEKGYTGTEEEFNTALAGMQNAPFLPLSGGTMTGNLNMGGRNLQNVLSIDSYGAEPIDMMGKLNLVSGLSSDGGAGIDFGGDRIQGVNTPTADTDAANKGYVDGKILYGTADPGVGSALATGTLYVVYE